jgi:hypothetical protein
VQARIWRTLHPALRQAPQGRSVAPVIRRNFAIFGALAALLVVAPLIANTYRLHTGATTAPPPLTATGALPATPTPISFLPINQVYGANWHPVAVTPALSDGQYFGVDDVTSDGRYVVGVVGVAHPSDTTPDIVGVYDTYSQTMRPVYADKDAGAVVKTDGRYVAWISPSAYTGGPGPVLQDVGYADLQTGAKTILASHAAITVVPNGNFAVDHGYFVYMKDRAFFAVNMATGATTALPITGLGYPQLQWPYLLYDGSSLGGATHWRLYSLMTGQDRDLALPLIRQFPAQPKLIGATLYWVDQDNRIMQLDSADQPITRAHAIFTLPVNSWVNGYQAPGLAITSRLFIWQNGTAAYAWDRQRQLGVLLAANGASAVSSARGDIIVLLVGPDAQHLAYQVVDTHALP